MEAVNPVMVLFFGKIPIKKLTKSTKTNNISTKLIFSFVVTDDVMYLLSGELRRLTIVCFYRSYKCF